ncbi:MAG: C4-type zinc ribbon domain-containing protein [Bacillota bacterium]|nr:C4-type zinc ribbon domain-containing protein [Bacillota bacterium]
MTEIQLLLELQGMDMQIRELAKTLAGLPVRKEIEDLEATLRALRASLADANARLARCRKEQKEVEWSLKETAAAIEAISRKLYGGVVTNPREIEGMRGKLKMLEAGKAKLEDRIIAYMEESEALEAQAKSTGEEIDQGASNLERLKSARDTRVSEIESEISGITERREALAAKVSGALLLKYEQLVKDKGGVAVAPVQGGICGGCHVVLPASLASRARPNDQVVRCESCGRILCWVG